MADIVFDIPAFRLQFPAFQNAALYPNVTLQAYWDTGTEYISDTQRCGPLSGARLVLALNLMTAHLADIYAQIAAGDTPSITTGATIDKISVTSLAPPTKNAFQYWLNLTPYGQQLLALLSTISVGGFWIGGRNEIGQFRRSGGY